MKRLLSSWLFAACAACTGSGHSDQVLTGTVSSSDTVAVRAVADGAVVTASRVHSDGSFTLAVPAGKQYALEVLTSSGTVRRLLSGGGTEIAFDVCQPSDPFDMGGIGSGSGSDCPPPPPPCDPTQDPNCKLPPPPPPPPCDPAQDPSCPPPPPPCDPSTDPNCKPPPPPPCDPTQDPNCTLPPPPCTDPSDPTTCKDPCMIDPQHCSCPDPSAGSGSGCGIGCWPPPLPGCGMVPDHPPSDFGCKGSGGS